MADYHRLKRDIQKLEELSTQVEDFFHISFPVAKEDDTKGMHYFREAVGISNLADSISEELEKAVDFLDLKMRRMLLKIALWDMEGEDLPLQIEEIQKRIKHFNKQIKHLKEKKEGHPAKR
ncbi:hypothetical protein [Candidatus Oleimmundimicrobium sp.]|uniref:hypothetical protein n=1 Tax=Candidatus Oleimmundimicrobium sp. TaxID=3060597 RepID=UPI002728B338|nr:hypothetical protein [Candidatus Oleimmundimicrobium sp.]MDO8885760.1 hypothetical protein [Candidatus Oleimmundimicrobium sp.]